MTRRTSSIRPSKSVPVAPRTPVPVCTIYRSCDVRVNLACCGVTFSEGDQQVPFLPGSKAEAEQAAQLLEMAAAHLRGLQMMSR